MGVGTGHGGGTLGCFFEDANDPDGLVVGVTNDHVLTSKRRPDAEVGRVVGHANRGFVCNGFCARAIGTIVGGSGDGHLDPPGPWIDAGFFTLDEGVQYSPSLHKIGPIFGERNLHDDDLQIVLQDGTQVLKRGRTTGTTGGVITGFDMHALNSAGGLANDPARTSEQGAVVIKPNPVWEGGAGFAHFIDDGDSGSVCIDLDGYVIALMHRSAPALGYGGRALGTGITQVREQGEALLAAQGDPIDLKIAEHDATRGMVRTAGGGDAVASLHVLEDAFQAMAEIGIGREVWRLWGLHADEILHLVNTNARVATVWHRSGLPILIQHLIRLAGDPKRRMPSLIDGEPIVRCVERFIDELARHAGPELRRDLATLGSIPDLAGCTYDEVVLRLEVV